MVPNENFQKLHDFSFMISPPGQGLPKVHCRKKGSKNFVNLISHCSGHKKKIFLKNRGRSGHVLQSGSVFMGAISPLLKHQK